MAKLTSLIDELDECRKGKNKVRDEILALGGNISGSDSDVSVGEVIASSINAADDSIVSTSDELGVYVPGITSPWVPQSEKKTIAQDGSDAGISKDEDFSVQGVTTLTSIIEELDKCIKEKNKLRDEILALGGTLSGSDSDVSVGEVIVSSIKAADDSIVSTSNELGVHVPGVTSPWVPKGEKELITPAGNDTGISKDKDVNIHEDVTLTSLIEELDECRKEKNKLREEILALGGTLSGSDSDVSVGEVIASSIKAADDSIVSTSEFGVHVPGVTSPWVPKEEKETIAQGESDAVISKEKDVSIRGMETLTSLIEELDKCRKEKNKLKDEILALGGTLSDSDSDVSVGEVIASSIRAADYSIFSTSEELGVHVPGVTSPWVPKKKKVPTATLR